ncbi:hypothetical protein GCM10020254_49390 [Streptomyces goshikiensis]
MGGELAVAGVLVEGAQGDQQVDGGAQPPAPGGVAGPRAGRDLRGQREGGLRFGQRPDPGGLQPGEGQRSRAQRAERRRDGVAGYGVPERGAGGGEEVVEEPVEGARQLGPVDADAGVGPGTGTGTGALPAEGAQQVVEAVPAGRRGLQHRHVHQGFQYLLHVEPIGPQGRRGGGQADAGAVEAGQHPEGARLFGGELAVAELEDGGDGQIADAQLVEAAALVGQPGGEQGDRPAGAGGEPGGHDPDGQGQEPAGGDELAGGFGFGVQPVAADHPAEQLQRLGELEDVQVGLVPGGQPRQPGSAGDEDGAPAGAGQQRAHLGGVARVVEHDEHPAAGGHRPEQRRPPLDVGGQGIRGDPERGEEADQDVAGVAGVVGVGAAQVGVQLAVGEAVPYPVGGVEGEGGLADAAHAGDQREGRPAVVGRGQGLGEASYEGGPAGEVTGRAGRLCGHGRRLRLGLRPAPSPPSATAAAVSGAGPPDRATAPPRRPPSSAPASS